MDWDVGEGSAGKRLLTRMVLVSLGLHLLVLLFFPGLFLGKGNPVRIRPTYTVDLVTLPGEGQALGPVSEGKVPSASPTHPPEAKAISLPKPVPEKVKRAKEDSTRSLEQALERLKKKVQQEKSLDQTFSRMEDRLKREQALERTLSQLELKRRSTSEEGGGSGDVTSSNVGSGGSGVGFRLYYAEVLSRIKRNWLLPENLLKRKDLSAVVMIIVQRSGRIEEVRFERKSGVEQFDQEVLRTLKKSDPLPPLPEGFPRSRHDIYLTFYSRELS